MPAPNCLHSEPVKPIFSQANALELACRSASVSYREALEPDALAQALVSGVLPEAIMPQVATLLDEGFLILLVGAVSIVSQEHGVPPKELWARMRQWAKALQSSRPMWHEQEQ